MTARRPRAGDHGEPRARVRLRRRGARPLERARGRRATERRAAGRASRARAPTSCRGRAEHLALRAFALVAPVEGHSFRFVNRIPLERGLGSSAPRRSPPGSSPGSRSPAATPRPTRCSSSACRSKGHADNLAAALLRRRLPDLAQRRRPARTRRLATDLPLAAIVVVPDTRVNTEASRSRLPATADARARPPRPRAGGAARRGDRRRRRRRCSRARSTTRCTSPTAPRTRRCSASCATTRCPAPPASRSRAPARPSSSGPRRTRSPRSPPSSQRAFPTRASCPSASPTKEPTAA